MDVKIFDLSREYASMSNEINNVFQRVAGNGDFVLGKEGKAFEEAFAGYAGVRFAAGVNSGTDAIRLGGLSCGLKAGDKIVTTPNTYIATVMALSMHGIVPVFCDIDPETYGMNPDSLEKLLEKEQGVKACFPVHLYGHPCDMDPILDICFRRGIAVIEDACQAHGALYKGRRIGSLGLAAAFSFYPTKNLGCYGDGGAVVTDSEEVYANLVSLRNYGQRNKHEHLREGFNSRLDEVQAALLACKLPHLDKWNEKRRELAVLYSEGLRDTDLVLPVEKDWAHHVYHLYVVRSSRRDEIAAFLKGKGIVTLVHYPTPVHLQPAYKHLGYAPGDFPEAENASLEILSLPLYPTLDASEVAYVCDSIKEFYTK